MIQLANLSEIDAILEMTKACALFMQKQGIFQWNAHYPSRSAFEKDVARNELYTLYEGQTLVGCVVVSDFMDAEYKTISWLTPNGKNGYVHRLAVHPDYQGKGYARQLLDFAEKTARKRGWISMRLDTFSQNPRNNTIYEKRGYTRLGDIFFPKQSEAPFHCYELVF
ncbi:GNAT family N-acetyltransferase [Sediminicola luteus]|uniref:GNAT family N-acetyltransferase n=1 Tax=Sediminicola luteus TaxID=319238 RepID=A0A2A4G4T2_9FLAO|nr:GNAT family N-acetyltransferase [Sediminicola luteus]PCE62974.1 GNAT family N-acetyltransferase [Sediminicola luteus]